MVHTSVIACHGSAVAINADDTFKLEHCPGHARVSNTSSTKTVRKAYFNIPSPERTTLNMKFMNVDFISSRAIITHICLFFGYDQILDLPVSKGESFRQNLSSVKATYDGCGISLALELEMPEESNIDFTSVAIECEGTPMSK